MKLKKNTTVLTDDFWYDLMDGGYIKPNKILAEKEDVHKINEAIKTLQKFKDLLEGEGIIKYN